MEMQPEVAIFWRSLFAAIVLGLFLKLTKRDFPLRSQQDYNLIMLGGGLMALHWVTYFYSLDLSNVAIAIITLHTYPAMTVLLEPLLLKTRFQIFHLTLAALVVTGVWIMTPEIKTDDDTVAAIGFGLFSAFAYAIRNIVTRKVMPYYHGTTMMFYQLCIMALMLCPFLYFKSSAPLLTDDWPEMIGLVFLTTCIGHTLLVVNLKRYKAVTVALLSSIIPIYGILWPYLFLGERPDLKTYIGGAFILATFGMAAYRASMAKKSELS
jgi:drug/metabolite transporter (DMT)-like permease